MSLRGDHIYPGPAQECLCKDRVNPRHELSEGIFLGDPEDVPAQFGWKIPKLHGDNNMGKIDAVCNL